MSRQSGYNEKMRAAIIRLIEDKDGKITDQQIADAVGVSLTTLKTWQGKHPELRLAIRATKRMADELVEASLFSRAIGYSHPEEKVFCMKDGSGEPTIIKHEGQKHYPPDTQAAMFWLRNRQPERWREKTEGDVNVNNTVNVGNLTDEQLEARIRAMLEKAPKPQEEG